MNKYFINYTWKKETYRWVCKSPPRDGSFDILDASENDLLSQYVKNPNKMWRTQNESSKKKSDNGDDDYDHGEE